MMNREYLYDRGWTEGSAGSPWLADRERSPFPPLSGEISTDVAVVGAGLAGTLTAARLAEAGHQVVLLEGRRIGSDVTGHTSGKATAQHGLMAGRLPRDAMLPWAAANSAAVARLKVLTRKYGVPEAFEDASSNLYVAAGGDAGPLGEDLDLYQQAGLDAVMVAADALPRWASASLRLHGQGCFDPVRLIDAIIASAPATLELHEGSMVRSASDDSVGVLLQCDDGSVRAGRAVFATHVPFIDTLVYSARLYQYRTYAAEILTSTDPPEGMWYTEDEPHLAWRPLRAAEPRRLVVTGIRHKAGQGGDEREHYAELFAACRSAFGEIEIVRWWSTQDAETPDGLPMIGKMAGRDASYLISGFNGWGMSTSEVAAEVVSELIEGREHPLADIVSPMRLSLYEIGALASENINVLTSALSREGHHAGNLDDVAPGEGKVMKVEGEHAAVMRDADGTVHVLNSHCPHLHCTVEFNEAEGTWDCPCHGSRYLGTGEWLHGPSKRSMDPVKERK